MIKNVLFSCRRKGKCDILELIMIVWGKKEMQLKWEINDYILIWELLFRASISKDVQNYKQKLWKNYKHSYNALTKEKGVILKEPKNYIPNDDTIFDIVRNSELYQELKQETEDYKNHFLKCYEEEKKNMEKELKQIIRLELNPCHILLLHPKLDIIEIKTGAEYFILWGRRKDEQDYKMALLNLIHIILAKKLEKSQPEYREYHEIVQAIIELAIDNELATRILKKSCYLKGDHSLSFLKKQIYPYWLMYVGYTKEEMKTCMIRDNLPFDLEAYNYERELKNFDLYQFIRFCIRHQRNILKINELEII